MMILIALLGLFFFGKCQIPDPSLYSQTPVQHKINDVDLGTYSGYETLLSNFVKESTYGSYVIVTITDHKHLNCMNGNIYGRIIDCSKYSSGDYCKSDDRYQLVESNSPVTSFNLSTPLWTTLNHWDGTQRETGIEIIYNDHGSCIVNISINHYTSRSAIGLGLYALVSIISFPSLTIVLFIVFAMLTAACFMIYRQNAVSKPTDTENCTQCGHKLHHFNEGPCKVIEFNRHTNCSCSIRCRGGQYLCHRGRVCNHHWTTRSNKRTRHHYCRCRECCCSKCKPQVMCGCNGCSCKGCKKLGTTYGATWKTSVTCMGVCGATFLIAIFSVAMFVVLIPAFSEGSYEGWFRHLFSWTLLGFSHVLVGLLIIGVLVVLFSLILNFCCCVIISGSFKDKYNTPISQVANPISIQNKHKFWYERHCYCTICSTNSTFKDHVGFISQPAPIIMGNNDVNVVNVSEIELQNKGKEMYENTDALNNVITDPFTPPQQIDDVKSDVIY